MTVPNRRQDGNRRFSRFPRCVGILAPAILVTVSWGLSGCGGSEDRPVSGAISPARMEDTSDSAGVAPERPGAPTIPAVSRVEVTDPLHRALLGTAWRVGEHRIRFLDADRVKVVSPRLEPYAPGGLITRYHLREGLISLNVMGNEIRLEWDGTQLKAEGMPAERES